VVELKTTNVEKLRDSKMKSTVKFARYFYDCANMAFLTFGKIVIPANLDNRAGIQPFVISMSYDGLDTSLRRYDGVFRIYQYTNANIHDHFQPKAP
jgi:hypothetical protein